LICATPLATWRASYPWPLLSISITWLIRISHDSFIGTWLIDKCHKRDKCHKTWHIHKTRQIHKTRHILLVSHLLAHQFNWIQPNALFYTWRRCRAHRNVIIWQVRRHGHLSCLPCHKTSPAHCPPHPSCLPCHKTSPLISHTWIYHVKDMKESCHTSVIHCLAPLHAHTHTHTPEHIKEKDWMSWWRWDWMSWSSCGRGQISI